MLPLLWPFFLCRTLVMVMAMTMNVMMKRQLLCQRFSLSRKAQPWWTHLDTEGPSLSSALSISSDFFIIINAIDVSKLVLFLLVPGLDQNMGTREGGGRRKTIIIDDSSIIIILHTFHHHHPNYFQKRKTSGWIEKAMKTIGYLWMIIFYFVTTWLKGDRINWINLNWKNWKTKNEGMTRINLNCH